MCQAPIGHDDVTTFRAVASGATAHKQNEEEHANRVTEGTLHRYQAECCCRLKKSSRLLQDRGHRGVKSV